MTSDRDCSAAARGRRRSDLAEVLRHETVGGVLLLLAGAAALVWANSPWAHAYRSVSELAFGPEALHLRLTLAQWAADGLLAIFFFVVGLELKREFVAGDLRDPARAALPIAAAIGGMIVPAADLRRHQPDRGAPREPRRVGGADRHRHRVRARRAGRAVDPPADRAADVPAHARGGRRSAGDHDHRRLLHRPSRAGTARVGPDSGWPLRGGRTARCAAVVAAGSAGGGDVGAGPRQRGARHGGRGAARLRRARCWAGIPPPSGSSTGCGRCRQGWRCRCSRSSPPG